MCLIAYKHLRRMVWLGLQAAYERILYVITAVNEVYKTIQVSVAAI